MCGMMFYSYMKFSEEPERSDMKDDSEQFQDGTQNREGTRAGHRARRWEGPFSDGLSHSRPCSGSQGRETSFSSPDFARRGAHNAASESRRGPTESSGGKGSSADGKGFRAPRSGGRAGDGR